MTDCKSGAGSAVVPFSLEEQRSGTVVALRAGGQSRSIAGKGLPTGDERGGAHEEAAARGAGAAAASLAVDPRLLAWLSPAFPVGGFAYSHGLELAAGRGWVSDRDGLLAWLEDLVRCGSLRNDLILLAAAWRATRDGRLLDLTEVNELALALQPSAERRLETSMQGRAFLDTIAAAWNAGGIVEIGKVLTDEVAYSVAVGTVAGVHRIEPGSTLLAYSMAFVGNLTSAAIRLSIIGQTDAQRVLSSLMPLLEVSATAGLASSLEDIGSATLRSDVASLAHETQYTRLFRS